jgi:hypothetical protein
MPEPDHQLGMKLGGMAQPIAELTKISVPSGSHKPQNCRIGGSCEPRRSQLMSGLSGNKKNGAKEQSKLPGRVYERELRKLRTKLVEMQEWVKAHGV